MKQPIVLLLAGGQSSRLWPLYNKPFLPFFGKSFLQWQVDAFKRVGLRDVVLVVNESAGHIAQGFGLPVVVQKGDGMAAALLSAQAYIQGRSVLVVIVEDMVDNSFYQTIAQHISKYPHLNFLTTYKPTHYLPMGYVTMRKDTIVNITEKPGKGQEPSEFVTIFSHYHANSNELLTMIKTTKSNRDDIYEKALQSHMSKGIPFASLLYQGNFAYLKYPWHMLSTMDFFLLTISKSSIAQGVSIAKSASISGPVVIEEGVRVMEYAKIIGPCYIGRNTIIGNHTMIRSSHIGQQCVIGFGSDVTRSYIGDLSWLHTNYIGDSVIGENVSMGAGSVLANLRLDEGEIYSMVKGEKIATSRTKFGAIIGDNVRIGVNCSIMPGVKIGKNSAIGAGVILDQDIPEGKFCSSEQKVTITNNRFVTNKSSREQFRKKI